MLSAPGQFSGARDVSRQVDILVIGGGVAGLTAGAHAARAGRATLILTGDIVGGQLLSIEKIDGLPEFPEGAPGYDFCPMLQEQAEEAGAEFLMTSATKIEAVDDAWRVETGEGEIVARGVIFAAGTSLKKLGAPGEDRLFGKGVSHCASCDAPLLRGKTAAVIGGGDSAMQEALTLAAHAGKVIMLDRGAALAGQGVYQEAVRANPKIEIRHGATVSEILGETEVTAVRTSQGDVECASVFAYIGLVPNTALLAGVVALDPDGRVMTDGAGRASAPGLCAVGNARAGSTHRAAGAIEDGAKAATALDAFLAGGGWRA
jgi:thioredoxin reductase (NADPH)